MFEAIHQYYRKLVPAFSDDELAELDSCLTIRHIPKGGYVVRAGQVCRCVSFVNKGVVREFYTADHKDVSVGFFLSGDYVAEYESFLTQAPAAASIDILEDAEIVDLDYAGMQRLYQISPNFQVFGRKMVEGLFIYLNRRNTALLSLTPEERYRQMIADQHELLQRVPQYMLASFIGVTPEHLSRIRKKMSQY